MADKDLFAPPSEEELFAAPSEEELRAEAAIAEQPVAEERPWYDVSPEGLETAVRSQLTGISEGLPFSGVGRAGISAAKAGYKTLTGEAEDFGEQYEKEQQAWQEHVAETASETPEGFYPGMVGAALATPGPKGVSPTAYATTEGVASTLARTGDPEEALTIGALGGAISKGGDLVGRLSRAKQAKADKLTEQSMGLHRTGNLRKKLKDKIKKGELQEGELGKFAREKGLGGEFKTMTTASKIDRTNDFLDQTGEEIGEIVAQGKGVDTRKLADRLRARADDFELVEKGTGDKLNKLADEIDKVAKGTTKPTGLVDEMGRPITSQVEAGRPKLSTEELRHQKSELGRRVKDFLADVPSKDASKAAYKEFSEAIEESLPTDQLRAALKAKNADYQKAKMLEEGLSGKEIADEGRSLFSMPNVALGGVVNPALPIARELGNTYGRSFAAAGLNFNKISKKPQWVEKYSEAIKKAAPGGEQQAIAATHFLLQQTDPAYKKAMDKKREERGE